MTDNVDGQSLSFKTKQFLTEKLIEKQAIISKLKKKRKHVKILIT